MNRGFILFHTVLILAAVSIIAVRYAGRQTYFHKTADAELKKAQAIHAAQSGIEMARIILENDPSSEDGPGDLWYGAQTIRFSDIPVTLEVQDEQAKLNINHLVHPSGEINRKLWRIFKRLNPGAGLDETDWLRFHTKWMDQFDAPLFSPGIARLSPAPLSAAGIESLTVHGNGVINVNSADARVLEAMVSSRGSVFAETVQKQRARALFTSVFELKQKLGLSESEFKDILPIATVGSSCFTISAIATIDPVQADVQATVIRQGGTTRIIRYREW